MGRLACHLCSPALQAENRESYCCVEGSSVLPATAACLRQLAAKAKGRAAGPLQPRWCLGLGGHGHGCGAGAGMVLGGCNAITGGSGALVYTHAPACCLACLLQVRTRRTVGTHLRAKPPLPPLTVPDGEAVCGVAARRGAGPQRGDANVPLKRGGAKQARQLRGAVGKGGARSAGRHATSGPAPGDQRMPRSAPRSAPRPEGRLGQSGAGPQPRTGSPSRPATHLAGRPLHIKVPV